jgi:type III secretion protein C
MNLRDGVLRAVLTLGLALGAGLAGAAELRWPSKPFQIVASEKRLADFLRELSASQGTTAVVDPKVDGVISGKFSGPGRTILDSVTATYGLVWFFDGALLHIDLASDTRTEVIPIQPTSADRVAQVLSRLEVTDKRFPLVVNGADGTVFVSGPRRYVEIVRQAVGLSDERASQIDRSQMRVFSLRYARAGDFRIQRNGRDLSVPGVVTTLRRLYGKEQGAARRGSATASPGLRVGANRQLRLRTGESINAPKVELGDDDNASSSTGLRGAPHDLPQFEPDVRMNAVIVRDLPERMAQYEQLLKSMDVEPRLVEIELTVMDVSSDRLQELGIDWRFHGSRGDLQIGRGEASPLTFGNATTEAGQTGAQTPAGVVITGLLNGDATSYVLARVRALSQNGQAQFVARPKVTTFDNTEALLENLSEFYIRVGGFQDAQLFSVVTGTAVRVTPQMVAAPVGAATARAPRVVLAIDIEDGNVTGESVDNVPVIRRRAVTTQAMVAEGRSLLIAGYSSEETVRAVVGVPGLSSMPIIGHLFKHQQHRRQNMERLYLLTPRVVSLEETL